MTIIMNYTHIADMSPDDLIKYRKLMSKENALMIGAETDFEFAADIFLDIILEDAYVLEKYGIDNRRNWTVDVLTGKIYYTDDPRKRIQSRRFNKGENE